MRSPTPGGSSSTGVGKEAQVPKRMKKDEVAEVVYAPCWNIGKNSLLTSMDEKKELVDNILPPGAKTKFEIYKWAELGSRIDHA